MYYKMKKGLKKIIAFFIVFAMLLSAAYMYFMINYPLSYQLAIKKYADEFNIDPYLIAAIINVESKYDKNAISSKEARGLMQIAPITANWASEELGIEDFQVEDLFIPEINIRIGAWYLSVLQDEFDDNLQLILAAYNAGSGNVIKWLEDEEYSEDGKTLKDIPFAETKEYVKKVEKNLRIYNILYEDEFDNVDDLISNKENYLIFFVNNFKKTIKNFIIYK